MSGEENAGMLEISCLGRPFQLGMLYDCRSDHLIPGKTLWGPEALNKAVNMKSQEGSDFEVIAEDSLNEKAFRLDVNADLKLSFLSGLVNVSGAAKYMDDRKSSQKQARVSLKYKTTSSFEQLTMAHLGHGQFEYPEVFDDDIATHVVTGVLHGADAFFVFDREVSKDEKYRDIHGNMEVLIKALPGITDIKGQASLNMKDNQTSEMEKFQCKFYGDFILPSNPSTFSEAVVTYKQLPNILRADGQAKTVPKIAYLYPLSKLDSRAQKIVREISIGLVSDVVKLMESIHEVEIQCNDLEKYEVSFSFIGIRNSIQMVKALLTSYKASLVKRLATLLPRIRGGGKEETELAEILEQHEISPFNYNSLLSWAQGKMKEVKTLDGFLKHLQKQKIEFKFGPGEMDEIISDLDIENILCFNFFVSCIDDGHLKAMKEYLRTREVSKSGQAVKPWHENQVLTQDIRQKLRRFKGFAEANIGSDVKFVVTDSSENADNGDTNIAQITLYQNGIPTVFDPPDQPGKPQKVSVTYHSIDLSWDDIKFGHESVTNYSVFYRNDDDEDVPGNWIKVTSSEKSVTISKLAAETVYLFKVRAEAAVGPGPESELSDRIQTKPAPPIRLALRMLESCKQISENGKCPKIYQLPFRNLKIKADLAKCDIGQSHGVVHSQHKVLMVVGATGAGKSTLLNSIANYIFGIEHNDDFRFKLIADEGGFSQAKSQTRSITAYTFHEMCGSTLPYTLTLIDTPGFGDTDGIGRDQYITTLIGEFFSLKGDEGIDRIHGIGFVAQAPMARLTPTQQYIFDSILSIFGKDIGDNIFLLITFADGQKPPVLEALQAANIPYREYFKFNNSALFAEKNGDDFMKMFWEMGKKSLDTFFGKISVVQPRSLLLTQEVLREREQLEATLECLQTKIHMGLSKINELEQEKQVMKQYEADILTSRDFTYTVMVTKHKETRLPAGRHNTKCLTCNFVCHKICAYANDEDKYKCAAMTRGSGRSTSCGNCPGNCHWTSHKNYPYIIETYQEMETKISADLKAKYNMASSGKSVVEDTIAKITAELEGISQLILYMIHQMKLSLERLDEIALKRNPLTEVQYIDLIVKSEEIEAKVGFQKRIQALEGIRKQAEMLSKLKDQEWEEQVNHKGMWEHMKSWWLI